MDLLTRSVVMNIWHKIILLTIMLCGSCAAMAQSLYMLDNRTPSRKMEMGVTIGAAYLNTTSNEHSVNLEGKVGLRAAMMMAFCWQEAYALQMEIGYVHNKIDGRRGEVARQVRSNIVEVPIMFSYRGLGPMRFNVGPVLSLASSGRYDTEEERIEFGRLRPTLGLTAGVGVEVSRHLLIEARFTANLNDTQHYFEGVEFAARSWWAALNIGYRF